MASSSNNRFMLARNPCVKAPTMSWPGSKFPRCRTRVRYTRSCTPIRTLRRSTTGSRSKSNRPPACSNASSDTPSSNKSGWFSPTSVNASVNAWISASSDTPSSNTSGGFSSTSDTLSFHMANNSHSHPRPSYTHHPLASALAPSSFPDWVSTRGIHPSIHPHSLIG